MEIKIIEQNKKDYLDLLLLADEQESMIDRYLDRGQVFALFDDDLKSICVVTQEKEDEYEIKNLATYEKYQGQGYGSSLIKYIFDYYKGRCKTMFVGTGNDRSIISFYENCTFEFSHIVRNFFIDNYDKPIYEKGIQLIDMIYLKRVFED